ncbi:hypothetical protein OS11_21500 [Dickeya oryzae]
MIISIAATTDMCRVCLSAALFAGASPFSASERFLSLKKGLLMLMLFLTVALVHLIALMSPGPDFFFCFPDGD